MTRKPKQPKPSRGAAREPETSEQMAQRLMAEAQGASALDGEIDLQRQVNKRLLALWDSLDHAADDAGAEQALQVKVAAALTTGTGRVARLLRDQRALTGQAADGLTAAIARALDEL